MTWDPREDAWFAGFTDGEGCFILQEVPRKYTYVHPRFVLALRADDLAVLESLQAVFGGSICPRRSAGNDRPCFAWTVVGKRGTIGLVEYFDRFPLRAKKARDYAVWRQAVRIYSAGSGRDPRLSVLREALMAGRRFDADAPDPIEPFEVQAALEID